MCGKEVSWCHETKQTVLALKYMKNQDATLKDSNNIHLLHTIMKIPPISILHYVQVLLPPEKYANKLKYYCGEKTSRNLIPILAYIFLKF